MEKDVFVEKIVPRKLSWREIVMQICIVAAAMLTAFLAVVVMPQSVLSLLPIIIFGICFGLWRLLQNFYVEHEYILTNGELDIDRIIAKRRRKRLMTVDTRGFELFARVSRENAPDLERCRRDARLLDCASSPKAENRFFAVCTPKNGVRTVLIFEPDERMTEAICKLIPRRFKL